MDNLVNRILSEEGVESRDSGSRSDLGIENLLKNISNTVRQPSMDTDAIMRDVSMPKQQQDFDTVMRDISNIMKSSG